MIHDGCISKSAMYLSLIFRNPLVFCKREERLVRFLRTTLNLPKRTELVCGTTTRTAGQGRVSLR